MKLMSLLVACGLAAAVTAQGGPDDVVDPLNNATLPPEQVFTTVACDVDNCESCFETDICQTCVSGYSANHSVATTGTCSKCAVDNCDMCDDAVDSCSQCKVGFSLSSTTTSDDDGNDVVVNSCTACEISDCGDCSTDDDGAEVCNACMEGFYMFDGGCAACGDNCAQCADVDASGNVGGCLVCDDTYEPEIDGSCLLIGTDCGSHCLECEEHNDCKTCEDGYSVMLYNNGESTGCAPCPSNCASCTDANTCDVCEDDFIMDEISGSCATQAQVYANVCDCRVSLNGGCTCVGDEDTSKDGCCDLGGMCDPDNADGVCATYSAGCDDFENCAYCFGQSFCGECDSGYYKTEGRAWGACIALPSGWDLELCSVDTLYDNQCSCGCGGVDPECVDHTVDNCDGDQVYCDADGACAECAIEGCAFCANGDAGTDTCSECMDGYDLNEDNTCTECDIDGCSSCSTGLFYDPETDTATEVTTCRTCMAGYFEDLETGACSQCDIANCEMCTGGECNNCLEGYSLQDDGSCDSCGDNCLQCGQSQCNRCATGYEIKDGSCQKTGQDCGDNCQVCQRGGQCKICDAGFYVGAGTNGKCVSCMSDCASCRDASSCTVCEEGYSYDINEFACLPAGDCLADICDCREDTNSGCTCLEDEDSAKLGCCNSDCGKCGDLCADFNNEPCTDFDNCEYCFEQTYCMECAENYYQPEYHGDCVALPEGWNVQDCPVDMLNNNVCDCTCGGYDPECDEWPAEDCASGEYCSSQAECLECSLAGCAHCSNGDGHIDGTCLECTDGHYQDDDGNCNNCDLEGCKECLLLQGEDGDTFSCKECSDGYYMNTEDTCAMCDVDNCESCNLEGDCEICETGFSLDAGVCSGCIENCLDCTGDTTTCKRCDDNYEVVEEDGTCGSTGNDCGDNCQVCGAQGICKQCLSTYFKDTDSSCQECMDNCGACSNGESCNDCVSGYGYVPERTACEAYSDPIDYCDAAIASGDLAEGSECECSGWECSEVSSRTLRLRRD